MKNILLLILGVVLSSTFLQAQKSAADANQQKEISSLIDKYSEAREKRDTLLLKKIFHAAIVF